MGYGLPVGRNPEINRGHLAVACALIYIYIPTLKCVSPHVVVMAYRISAMQMGQAKLYENQNTRHGRRRYGASVHYHYMSSNSSVESYGGAKMVHSTITEMISNVSL